MTLSRMNLVEKVQWVVTLNGRALWFNSKAEAEDFMRSVEDSLLFQ